VPQLNPYLVFDGNCAEAMRFYQRTLGGTLDLMTHGESPIAAHTPPGSADRIMHARLTLDGQLLMASDSMVGHPYPGDERVLSLGDLPDRRRGEAGVRRAGRRRRIVMPLQKTFWAEAFGMLVDRYGTPWMANGELGS
jgi:PhnB protein